MSTLAIESVGSIGVLFKSLLLPGEKQRFTTALRQRINSPAASSIETPQSLAQTVALAKAR
jgi:hypothetical protein